MTFRLFDSFIYFGACALIATFVIYVAVSPPDAFLPDANASSTGHNIDEPFDVDGNGLVNSTDAALVMDTLRDLKDYLPLSVDQVDSPHPFLDVNNDGYLSSQDAKAVVLFVNKIGTSARHSRHSASVPHADPAVAQR